MNNVARRIALQDLPQPRLDIHRPTIDISSQVAVGQRLKELLLRWWELIVKTFDTSLGCLDDGTGVMSDQPVDDLVDVMNVAKVSRAVKRMEPTDHER